MTFRFAITMLAIGAALTAAHADDASVYKPQSALQSTPMRVEVIDATSFRDIRLSALWRRFLFACSDRELQPSVLAVRGRRSCLADQRHAQ